MIASLRTPDDRFESLPGFPFQPHYLEDLPGYEGLRMHYLDEGPADAQETFLCLHGQPSWCYLYRKMIPLFTAAGHRSIAPDFYGFGRSDKPRDDATYTFDFHREALMRFIEALNLQRLTLVCQDWGGLLGLTLPMDMADRFHRLIVMNTGLATGDVPLGEGFLAWRKFCRETPDLPVGALLGRATPGLGEAEQAAYDAPFPDISYKAGVRRFPEIVPDKQDSPGAALARRARDWWRSEWDGPSFMAVGVLDPVLGVPAMKRLRSLIRGCPEPMMLEQAGHFVQEAGEPVARAALAAFSMA